MIRISSLLAIIIAVSFSLFSSTVGAEPPRPKDAAFPLASKCDIHATHKACVLDVTPNDPMYPQQYGPQIISAPAAWSTTTGSATTVLAIVDTGIDCTHPDLAGKCVAGFDFIHNVPLTGTENSDDYGHGTHVSCIAACNTNNATGVAGVCWQCKVMPVKVCDSSGSCSSTTIDAGNTWAADHGAQVINMSLGGTDCQCETGVNYAYNHGLLVISACGNTGAEPCLQPGAYANSMAVSCTDSADVICGFSSQGVEVDISAPGNSVLAAVPTGACSLCSPSGYQYLSGTSMSTPHVTGTAGLALANHSGITSDQMWGLLEQSSDDKGTVGFDNNYGFGRVNANGAVTESAPSGRLNKSAPPPCGGHLNPNNKCVGKGH